MKTMILLSCAATFLAASGFAAEVSSLSKLRVKEAPAQQLFCASKELKIGEIGQFVSESVPAMEQKLTELKAGIKGPLILTYVGFHGDASETFTAEIALPVARVDSASSGSFSFRESPKHRCASVIYQGSVKGIGDAWEQFIKQMEAAGLKPGGDGREIFLAWEGADSENNIIELQLRLP